MMKIRGLILITLSLAYSQANADFSFGTDSFEGKVRAVALDTDVKVRVVSIESGQTKLIKICETKSSAGENQRQAKLAVLRAALEQQATVRLSYSDVFESCLDKVEVVETTTPEVPPTAVTGIRKASAPRL